MPDPVDAAPGRAAETVPVGCVAPRTSARGNGTASPARYRALPRECDTAKTVGKPCAGNPHARFERWIWKRGGVKPPPRQDSTNEILLPGEALLGLNGVGSAVRTV